MDNEKLIEDLRGLLKQYGEKIPYGELVGAPWPYSRAGDLVWQDPEPYFIEQAATALSMLQVENEKLRDELKQVKAERDAALEHLHGICSACKIYSPYHNRGKCRFCAYEPARDKDAEVNDNWEWRGPQKEDGHGTALQNDTLCV